MNILDKVYEMAKKHFFIIKNKKILILVNLKSHFYLISQEKINIIY